jgi:hypothetical protein
MASPLAASLQGENPGFAVCLFGLPDDGVSCPLVTLIGIHSLTPTSDINPSIEEQSEATKFKDK